MQSQEFNKLMDLQSKLEMPKIARLENVLKGMTQEEKLAEIKKNETEMSPELHADIQKFVSEQLRLGKKKRQVRKLVKSKYKIIVV